MKQMKIMNNNILSFLTIIYVSFGMLAQTTDLKNSQISLSVPPNSNWCLGCICEAISNCSRTRTCQDDTCGIFAITWGYWVDAGKPTVAGQDPNSTDAFQKCTSDLDCAGITVTQYLKRFATDCNGDGEVTCYDYAAIHLRGGWGGCKEQPLSGNYLSKFLSCEAHSLSLLKFQIALDEDNYWYLNNYGGVLTLLKETKSSSSIAKQESSQLATVLYETTHYLQNLPCNEQCEKKIDQLMMELKNFPLPLSKLEKLMICNNPPETPLQLSLIVEDLDENFSEDSAQFWIGKIKEILS